MSTLKPEYIVAIGGATGYLEPLLRFFDRTLNDSVSYVILRYVSADAQNLLKKYYNHTPSLKYWREEITCPLKIIRYMYYLPGIT